MLKLAAQSQISFALQLNGFVDFCKSVDINLPKLAQNKNNVYFFNSLNDELIFIITAIGWSSAKNYNNLCHYMAKQLHDNIKNNIKDAYKNPSFIKFSKQFDIPTPSFLFCFKNEVDKIAFISFYNGFNGFMLNLNK